MKKRPPSSDQKTYEVVYLDFVDQKMIRLSASEFVATGSSATFFGFRNQLIAHFANVISVIQK